MGTKNNHVAMLVFSYYPNDVRVRREAEALAQSGFEVDIICLQGETEEKRGEFNKTNIYRLPVRRKRSGKFRYLWQYVGFIILAFLQLSFLHVRKKYHIIHVHNMPDILVLSALIPRLTGAKIILDLHDPMPELYMTLFRIKASNPMIRVLFYLEKLSIRFSNLALTPNKAFRDIFISRGCPDWKIHVVMNSPQEDIFKRREKASGLNFAVRENAFVLMFHGNILERHGLDTALEALARLKNKIPNLLFHVYGDGDFVPKLLEKADRQDLKDIVKFHGIVPLEEIAFAINSIDLGIIPNKMTPFTNVNLPTRIFEYLSMYKPVVVPRTKGIMDYFDEESLLFFDAGNVDSLTKAILAAYNNPSYCKLVLEKGIKVYKEHRWELQKKHFVQLVKKL